MRITFVLPSYEPRPSGGFRIVYEYANRLAAEGHSLTLVHPWRTGLEKRTPRELLYRARIYPDARRGRSWFPLGPGVRYELVPRLDPALFPNGDAIFATAWRTAEPVAQAHPSKGRGIYLVQSYEVWDGSKEEVDATWRLPLHKVVIAQWLEELSEKLGEAGRTTYIPNAIDFEQFFISTPIERRPKRVGMLWHHWEIKGTVEGVEALRLAQEREPELDIVLFGTRRAPKALPLRMTYVRSPSGGALRDLYNSFSIFLHPSRLEGWPLPPAEAMACGCAVVAAANQGILDYAVDAENALLAPIEDARGLAERIGSLLEDAAHRQRLAQAGEASVRGFTWDRALSRMKQVLQRVTAE